MSFFTALLDIGILIGGPILGALIDTAGWSSMYVFSGVFLAVATVIFARWDRRATDEETEPEAAIPGRA